MKTYLQKATFTIETGKYRDTYTITFEDAKVTVTNIHGEIIFVQHYYHDATQYAAIDILEMALIPVCHG